MSLYFTFYSENLNLVLDDCTVTRGDQLIMLDKEECVIIMKLVYQ